MEYPASKRTKRVRTKIGDVFEVKIDDTHKKYFQLVAFDLEQLNSDVIRAFERSYSIDDQPDVADIVDGDVQFYAHCVTSLGVTLNYWGHYGYCKDVGSVTHVLFRDSSDYGNRQVLISDNWWVWKVGEPQVYVGRLEGRNRTAEIGLVFNPESIVYRMQHGVYDHMWYPGFE